MHKIQIIIVLFIILSTFESICKDGKLSCDHPAPNLIFIDTIQIDEPLFILFDVKINEKRYETMPLLLPRNCLSSVKELDSGYYDLLFRKGYRILGPSKLYHLLRQAKMQDSFYVKLKRELNYYIYVDSTRDRSNIKYYSDYEFKVINDGCKYTTYAIRKFLLFLVKGEAIKGIVDSNSKYILDGEPTGLYYQVVIPYWWE